MLCLQFVVDRQDVGAGHAEDNFDVEAFHVFYDQFAELNIYDCESFSGILNPALYPNKF